MSAASRESATPGGWHIIDDRPEPPAWLVTWCELHSMTRPVYSREDLDDEWLFRRKSDGQAFSYVITWDFNTFARSMEGYV